MYYVLIAKPITLLYNIPFKKDCILPRQYSSEQLQIGTTTIRLMYEKKKNIAFSWCSVHVSFDLIAGYLFSKFNCTVLVLKRFVFM